MKTPGINRLKSDRPRSERDYYRTPPKLCFDAIDHFLYSQNFFDHYRTYIAPYHIRILDPGCGDGVWSQAAANLMSYYGKDCPVIHAVDLEPKTDTCKEYSVFQEDFLSKKKPTYLDGMYDVVLGNPPYSLAEEFIRKSMEQTRQNGFVYFLLQLNFLGSRKRQIGLFKDFPIKQVTVLTRRPSFFSVDGKYNSTDTMNYAMFCWQKGYTGPCTMDWLYWNYE